MVTLTESFRIADDSLRGKLIFSNNVEDQDKVRQSWAFIRVASIVTQVASLLFLSILPSLFTLTLTWIIVCAAYEVGRVGNNIIEIVEDPDLKNKIKDDKLKTLDQITKSTWAARSFITMDLKLEKPQGQKGSPA